jgi:hypothetical protein
MELSVRGGWQVAGTLALVLDPCYLAARKPKWQSRHDRPVDPLAP